MTVHEVYGIRISRPRALLLQGNPGSGKTTLAGAISSSDAVYRSCFGVTRWNDYSWLFAQFLMEQERARRALELNALQKSHISVTSYQPPRIFEANSAGGFDIRDLRILDTALQLIAQQVSRKLRTDVTFSDRSPLTGLPLSLDIGDIARPFDNFAEKAKLLLGDLREVLTIIVVDTPRVVTDKNILSRQSKVGPGEEAHNPGSPSIIQSVYYNRYIPGEKLCIQLAKAGFYCILFKKESPTLNEFIQCGQEITHILFN